MMRPENDADAPETFDPPFTTSSAEGLLIGVPIGILLLVLGGAMRLNVTSFKRFLLICIGAGLVGTASLSRRRLIEKLSANQRTLLEMLILLGFASTVCYCLLKMFLEGRAG